MSTNQKVVVIVGPTASGKTALSLKLAKILNGEIISADSRQVYRGMDIGTGKISKDEMGSIRHHLIDVAHPSEEFNVSDFKPSTKISIYFRYDVSVSIVCIQH